MQWLAVAVLALTVKHNGWLYYAGGDQLWHYSGAYLLAHGHLPATFVGYGWSVLLLPVAAVRGTRISLQRCRRSSSSTRSSCCRLRFYAYTRSRRASQDAPSATSQRRSGSLLPYLGILFVEPGYHQKYTELTLPQVLGLSSVPDFPAMVALLVSAYFCLRALEVTRLDDTRCRRARRRLLDRDQALERDLPRRAGCCSFVVEKRRALLTFAAGLAPALLTLAIWKYRGLGQLAAAPAEQVRLASGVGGLVDRIHNPQLNSYAHFRAVLQSLREHFWVARVMEWLPVAGTIALLARSRRVFLLVGAWFAIFVVAKATYVPASVEDASFWRILMPSFPAYLLLTASVVLLVPGVRARPAPESFTLARAPGDRRPRRCGRSLRRPAARSDRRDAGVEGQRPPGGPLRRQPAAGVVRRWAPGKRGQRRRAPVVARAEAAGGDRRLLPGAAHEELDRRLVAPEHGRPTSASSIRRLSRQRRPASYDDQSGAGDLHVPRRCVGELARRPSASATSTW